MQLIILHGDSYYMWSNKVNKSVMKRERNVQWKQVTLTTFMMARSQAMDFCSCWMQSDSWAELRTWLRDLRHSLIPGATSSSLLKRSRKVRPLVKLTEKHENKSIVQKKKSCKFFFLVSWILHCYLLLLIQRQARWPVSDRWNFKISWSTFAQCSSQVLPAWWPLCQGDCWAAAP